MRAVRLYESGSMTDDNRRDKSTHYDVLRYFKQGLFFGFMLAPCPSCLPSHLTCSRHMVGLSVGGVKQHK